MIYNKQIAVLVSYFTILKKLRLLFGQLSTFAVNIK